MESIEIDLPLPSRLLHPNARPHYMAKARQTRNHRFAACVMATAARTNKKPWKSASVLLRFTFADKRARDRDGLLSMAKAYIDGVADAGVVENDSQMTFLPVEITSPNKLRTGVKIIVTNLD